MISSTSTVNSVEFGQIKHCDIYQTIIIIYFIIYLPWRENKDLLAVLVLNNEGKVGTIDVYAKPLFSHNNMGFSESLEHISQVAISVAANQNASADIKQKLFDTVDKAFGEQLARTPDDARYRLFYGNFFSRFGWYGKALEQLMIAEKLSPQKQQIYFEIVNNSLLDGKTAQALEAAKTAYELAPTYEEARFIYGITLLASGDILAAEILKDVPESKIIFDDRYLTILLTLRKYQEIIDVAKRRIELDPSNSQHMVTLTAAYLQAGMRPEAVQTLEKLIEMKPDFKEQGEYYINEIKAGRNP